MKEKMWPRDAGGSFKLEGGTGPLTANCNCGDFIEVFKADITFRVTSPEGIDPARTNPHAPWVALVSDNVGSAHLAVARVLLQGRQLLDGAIFKAPLDKPAIVKLLHTIKEELVACDKVASSVRSEVDTIIALRQSASIVGASPQRMLNPFPQVGDLDGRSTTFLIRAKRAIRVMCSLPSNRHSGQGQQL